MICQFCEIEYPEGTERCSGCGSDLVDELPSATAELVIEPLAELYSHRELELLSTRLEAASIPYSVQSGTAIYMQESQALSDSVRPSQWLARIAVVSSRFHEAQRALEDVQSGLPGGGDDDQRDQPDHETSRSSDFRHDRFEKNWPR